MTQSLHTSAMTDEEQTYASNPSFVSLYEAESRYVSCEAMCREALFILDGDLYFDLPASWPSFAGQYEHLSAIVKDGLENIHRYAAQRTMKVLEWIKDWLNERREVNKEKATQESVYRPTYEVTVESLDSALFRLKDLNDSLKTLLAPYLPPIKMNAPEKKQNIPNYMETSRPSKSIPKMAKSPLDSIPSQNQKPASRALPKSGP